MCAYICLFNILNSRVSDIIGLKLISKRLKQCVRGDGRVFFEDEMKEETLTKARS